MQSEPILRIISSCDLNYVSNQSRSQDLNKSFHQLHQQVPCYQRADFKSDLEKLLINNIFLTYVYYCRACHVAPLEAYQAIKEVLFLGQVRQ